MTVAAVLCSGAADTFGCLPVSSGFIATALFGADAKKEPALRSACGRQSGISISGTLAGFNTPSAFAERVEREAVLRQ